MADRGVLGRGRVPDPMGQRRAKMDQQTGGTGAQWGKCGENTQRTGAREGERNHIRGTHDGRWDRGATTKLGPYLKRIPDICTTRG
eukprot:1268250-Pleurochrysis_carterae.AAC.1